VLSGVLGSVGILSLYGGLAVGRMGVVAPVTGVLARRSGRCGIALEARRGVVLLGIGLVIVAAACVDHGRCRADGWPSGLGYAIAAGPAGTPRRGAVAVSDGWSSARYDPARRQAVRRRRRDRAHRPAVALAANPAGGRRHRLLDMAGRSPSRPSPAAGDAAIVSSLYPVTTVVLATPCCASDSVSATDSIVCALAAIVCIGAGSAG
jgi:hypothetical protein